MQDSFFSSQSVEYLATNSISIVCATLVVIIILLLKRYRSDTADRISLNLQAIIAFVDIIRHFLYIFTHSKIESLCVFIAFLTFTTSHLYTLLNVSIAANLQLVYIHGIIPGKKWRIFIYSVPFIIALGVDLLALGFGVYGLDQYGTCFLNENSNHYAVFNIIQSRILRVPGFIYCLVIFLTVAAKLIFTSPSIEDEENIGERTPLIPNLQSPESRNFAFRISFYPLSCFISNSGMVALSISDIFSINETSLLSVWLLLGPSLAGILNLVSFLLDPVLKSALTPIPKNNPEPSAPNNRLTGLYGTENRPPTPYNSDYDEPNSNDNSDTQSTGSGSPVETDHSRYIRQRTEEQERINNAMPTSFW